MVLSMITIEKRRLFMTKIPNRLIHEKSPYLLQHAYNPVNWFPWGEEAFQKAREEDKPIFLSIGYSTCHWCHVMERESFLNEELAHLLNQNFVAIKVDREERPDIDAIYMDACQILTGGGGWPLTIVMTPEKKPFFADTYIPLTRQYGKTGLIDILTQIKNIWISQREDVLKASEELTAFMKSTQKTPPPSEPDKEIIPVLFKELLNTFDSLHGGFGPAPKFPFPVNHLFLLRYWKAFHEPAALKMVTKTLQMIRIGGIYDHLSSGFHRYATDLAWHVPHFEKMIYDQALLLLTYAEAYHITQDPLFKNTTYDLYEFVLKEMTHPEGGFYTAIDADSDGEEGSYYLWTQKEIQKNLSEEEAVYLNEVFSIQQGGNYFDPSTGKKTKKNILFLEKPLHTLIEEKGWNKELVLKTINNALKKLFETRNQRNHPFLDTTILVSWNGLMIAALARASRILSVPGFQTTASHAADFILNNMKTPDGGLWHRFQANQADVPAIIDDYAFFIWGLIELYQATFKSSYLIEADQLMRYSLHHFWDKNNHGFYMNADFSESLPFRKKEFYDGAIPSGNSVAFLDLILLSRLLSDFFYQQKAKEMAKAFFHNLKTFPTAHLFFGIGLLHEFGPNAEAIIAGDLQSKTTQKIFEILNHEYCPQLLLLHAPTSVNEKTLPHLNFYHPIDGKPTLYLCQNYQCQPGINDIEKIKEKAKTL